MLQFLQDQDSCTLTHDKTGSFLIKRDGCTVLVIGQIQCMHYGKTAYAHFTDAGLGTAAHHHILITVTDVPECFADRVITAGTCGYDTGADSLEPGLDGDLTGCHICNGHGNVEG